MTTQNTTLVSWQANGQLYADPLKPDYTVRFKAAKQTKSLGGRNVTNFAQEIIINDANPVVVGDVTVADALSVRIRVSGSGESMARMKQILSAVATMMPGWNTADVWKGFPPSSAPINIV